ncbi:flavin reductase family protein [Paracoccus jiaweipingae]|uniref:flavin reductase family protein n=1 Tax=unclassified Paracoccus (in: a-proteobacteria) TaxID=2688777 RepID=UPI00378B5885
MFYRPENGHGLPHNPFNAIVAPRPIGWVSSRGTAGDNLAPYSFFNAVAYTPPQVMFASTGTKPDRPETKDSVAQIAQSGVFCINIAPFSMRAAMNATSAPLAAGQSEFEAAGIAAAECETIDCPRVADAAAALECRVGRILPLAGTSNTLVIGVVTGIHIHPDCLRDGRFDLSGDGWLARMGYHDYARITDLFEMERP